MNFFLYTRVDGDDSPTGGYTMSPVVPNAGDRLTIGGQPFDVLRREMDLDAVSKAANATPPGNNGIAIVLVVKLALTL